MKAKNVGVLKKKANCSYLKVGYSTYKADRVTACKTAILSQHGRMDTTIT